MRRLIMLTALAAVAALVAGCGTDQQPDDGATPTPTPTDSPDATPTTSDEEPDADDTAIALGADGRVVALDADTGDELRELLTDVPVDDPASNDLAMTPDGDAVFVVVPSDETGPSDIVRIPVAGGEPEAVTQGTVPAVSPDGSTLAYVDYRTFEEPRSPEPVLVLRDLDSGEETRLTREEPFHFVPDVAWTPDGEQVVFTAGEIGTGLYAVDRDAASLDEARRLGPDLEGEDEGTSWGPVAAHGEDRLAVVETCCDAPDRQTWHVVSVGVSDGTAEGSLLPGDRVEATHIDSDAEAARLLLVVRGGPSGGELHAWDGSGEPVQIADGVIAATW